MNKNHCKQENIRLGTHGEDYGSWMSNPVFYIIGGIMEQVHRVVLSHLDYDGEGKILEVGCGSGALTIRSALTWPKAKVIGVDHWGAVYNYSKALCEKNAAREGVASRCVFQHGDAKQLDFPDESFDVVISNYVYHNVMGADMQKLLLESLRVLKKGGVFALNDDMKPKMYGDMEGFAQKLRDMGYEEVRLVDIAQEAFGSRIGNLRKEGGSFWLPPSGCHDDAGVFPAACRQKVMCQNRRFGYVQVRSRGGYTVRPYAGKNLC